MSKHFGMRKKNVQDGKKKKMHLWQIKPVSHQKHKAKTLSHFVFEALALKQQLGWTSMKQNIFLWPTTGEKKPPAALKWDWKYKN